MSGKLAASLKTATAFHASRWTPQILSRYHFLSTFRGHSTCCELCVYMVVEHKPNKLRIGNQVVVVVQSKMHRSIESPQESDAVHWSGRELKGYMSLRSQRQGGIRACD